MDLRVKKTEKAIRHAFYKLIQEKPIEKITVRELSEIAEINKTTFYSHYDTIYDLVNTLEQETIASILIHLDECGSFFSEPGSFIKNMYMSFGLYPHIRLTSSSLNSQRFVDKLNTAIQEELKQKKVSLDQYHNVGVLLTFIINGILGLLKRPNSTSVDSDIDYIERFVKGGIQSLGLANGI